ncbi:primase, DNA, polypeptide 1 (49kDa) [Phlyctochytrium planicorne]|nr:primase, DNA, polypeptide 1 (49kDa) [Phlyctochytrium planicorne]
MTRIGSDPNEASLSSFTAEMKEAAYVLHEATEKSLILIDELGRGSSYTDGLSLAVSICEELVKNKAFTFVATHFTELAQTMSFFPNVGNLQLEVEVSGVANNQFLSRPKKCVAQDQGTVVKYHYVVKKGFASDSEYGILMARAAGITPEICDAAENLLPQIARFLRRRNLNNDVEDCDDNIELSYDKRDKIQIARRLVKSVQHSDFGDFTLESDAYIRFQSFTDSQELKQEVLKLSPIKIDIGAVYNAKPKDKKALRPGAFQPKERELVFDIDLTDYDEVRTCCSEANICRKCWVFMAVAMKVIHRILTDEFGFKNIFWVYSGRRGVHCWVSDTRAKKLTAEGRRAIVSYIDLVRGTEETGRKANFASKMNHRSVRFELSSENTPDTIRISHDVSEKVFTGNLILNQDVLSTPAKWQKLLQMISDDGFALPWLQQF